jgi:peptide/nickel transport system permease protein
VTAELTTTSPELPTGEGPPEGLAIGAEAKPRSQWQLFRRRFMRHRLAMVGLVMLVVLFILCFGASWIAPYDRNEINLGLDNSSAQTTEENGGGGDLLDQLLKEQEAKAAGTFDERNGQGRRPSAVHWFGTDILGRDYLTEVLFAGQISLKIGVAVALVSTIVGALVGAAAGYFGKWSDQLLMRLTDLFLIVPAIAILAIALKKFGQTDTTIILVLAGLSWMTIGRVVRGQTMALREREFVDAAKVAGASSWRVIFRHLLPNMIGPITVAATFNMAAAIIAESTLSYLGYGVQPPKTSWGNMLASASEFTGSDKAYLLYFPGLFVLMTVLAINFIGDGLRDAFDPQTGRR